MGLRDSVKEKRSALKKAKSIHAGGGETLIPCQMESWVQKLKCQMSFDESLLQEGLVRCSLLSSTPWHEIKMWLDNFSFPIFLSNTVKWMYIEFLLPTWHTASLPSGYYTYTDLFYGFSFGTFEGASCFCALWSGIKRATWAGKLLLLNITALCIQLFWRPLLQITDTSSLFSRNSATYLTIS